MSLEDQVAGNSLNISRLYDVPDNITSLWTTVHELSAKNAELEATVAGLGAGVTAINTNADYFWLLFGTVLVFQMQGGFALLEAGSVRAKNTKNILLKNLLDACVGGLVWWAFGYSFAYGEGGATPNEFIGGKNFFLSSPKDVQGVWAFWMFQWSFAAAATTIVSGAVAERCNFNAYLIYTCVITGYIYPVVVHWGWSGEGWLSAFKYADTDSEPYDPSLGANGMIDFAGSGIVHMTGGACALSGAYFIGPRAGRFRADGTVVDFPAHSTVLATLGTFMLWFGWYGFNPASTLVFSAMEIAGKVAVTTTLAACAGGCTTLIVTVMTGGAPDVGPVLNGILAGLVSITGPCVVVEPYAAALIGVIGGLIYYGSSWGLKRLTIDDPLDASPVHFFCGMWGVIASGLFATEFNTINAYGTSTDDYGAFYGGGGKQLGIQFVGCLAIATWSIGLSALLFFGLSQMKMLRVSPEDEQAGLDESHHGGSAYDFGVSKTKEVPGVIREAAPL